MGLLRRLLGWVWEAIDGLRRLTLNLLFLALIAGGITLYLDNRPTPLQPHTTLLLDLGGRLVEQESPRADSLISAQLFEKRDQGQVVLRDVLEALDAAAQDPLIERVVLKTDGLQAGGLAILDEVAQALERFKKTGKPVIAWADHYDQRQYRVAAHADRIYLDPLGQVLIQGFGHYRNYYHDALERLGVHVNLLRVGTYKSFGEPFVANGPSPAALEADASLYNDLWARYGEDVERARHLPAGALQRSIDQLPVELAALKGDAAALALQGRWVDQLETGQGFTDLMKSGGRADESGHDYRQIGLDDYLARQKPNDKGPAVAVVVAEGEIREGDAPPGAIGGESTADLIRSAREDDDVKALVLRIDSPGGSAHASELIRRELVLTRAAGKPVVVSMGNLAASGGYWIGLAADQMLANPDTVTGSIGVFALVPTAEHLLDKVGVHTGGTTTTWLSDADNLLRPLDPRLASLLQTSVNHIYADFIQHTAESRHLPAASVEAVAQGRVWSGAQALQRQLVDRLGRLDDAIAEAARRAHLGAHPRLSYYDPEMNGWQRWLARLDQALDPGQALFQRLASLANPSGIQSLDPLAKLPLAPLLGDLISGHQRALPLVHCLCGSP